MSIIQIKHYFELCQDGETTFDERLQILKELEAKTIRELEQAKKRYACIEEKIKHCEDIRAGKCEDDMTEIREKMIAADVIVLSQRQ